MIQILDKHGNTSTDKGLLIIVDKYGNIKQVPGSTGTVTSIGTIAPLTGGPITTIGTLGITQSGILTDGYLSTTDWNTFNNKQSTINLTTTGSSGAATLIGTTLNIPDYSSALSSYLPLTGGTLTGNLLFSTDNTRDIGATGATRPRTGYFGTSIVAPLQIGGTSTTQTLTYRTTTGIGATGADHIFQVGNNGATEAMRILNNGNVGIGTNSAGLKLSVTGEIGIPVGNAYYFRTSDANWRMGSDIITDVGGMLTAQTIQITTGNGAGQGIQYLNSGSTTPVFEVAGSDGSTRIGGNLIIGSTIPIGRLGIPVAPTASANYGLVSFGSGAFNGVSAGFYIGNPLGTVLAINAASGYAGDLVNWQIAGAAKYKVASNGDLSLYNDVYLLKGIGTTQVIYAPSGNGVIEFRTSSGAMLMKIDASNVTSVAISGPSAGGNVSSGLGSMTWNGKYGVNTASGTASTAFGEGCQATGMYSTAHGTWGKAPLEAQYTHANGVNSGSFSGYSRLVKSTDFGNTKSASIASTVMTVDFGTALMTNATEGTIFSLKITNTIITRTTSAPLVGYDSQVQIDYVNIVYRSGIIVLLAPITNYLTNGDASMLTGGITYTLLAKILTVVYTTPTGFISTTARFIVSTTIDITGSGY